MRCTKCGHKLRIGDEFCSKCGFAIEPDIIYEDRDAGADHTKAYRPNRKASTYEDSIYESSSYEDSAKNRNYYDYEYTENDDYKENEHDITGTINLDYEDTRAKKASKWTSKGIIAAIGIAAAFVIAIIVVNVQNALKSDEDIDVGEAAETTASETVIQNTEAENEVSGSSSWKNPFESLFPSRQEDNSSAGKNDSSGSNSEAGSYTDSEQKDSGSYSYEGNSRENNSESYDNKNSSSAETHGQREDSPTTQYYEDKDDSETYTDIYGDDYTDEDNDSSYTESFGDDVRDFFEDIGGHIRDTAGEYGDRLDESINEFGDRLWDGVAGRRSW